MDARTTRLGVSLVLVVILAGLVALAPNGWWALAVFVVLIPVVFASLIWAAGQPVTPTAVVLGSTAMAAGVAAYLLVVLGLGRLMGPIAWLVVPIAALLIVALVRRRVARPSGAASALASL
jgi:hypothetical protein